MKKLQLKQRIKEMTGKPVVNFATGFALGTAIYVLTPTLLNKLLKTNKFNGLLGLLTQLGANGLGYVLTKNSGIWYAFVGHTIGQVIYYGTDKFLGEVYDLFPDDGGVNDWATPDTQYLTPATNSPSFALLNDYRVNEVNNSIMLNDYTESYDLNYN